MSTTESAVAFATNSRAHIGLGVTEPERSIDFYRVLLDVEPTKRRPGYARFEVADPPLNLSLIRSGARRTAAPGPLHYGIQVRSSTAVRDATARLERAGLSVEREDETTCCFATQTKVWATDPDGHRWEVFVVLDDGGDEPASTASACCDAPAREGEGAVRDGALAEPPENAAPCCAGHPV